MPRSKNFFVYSAIIMGALAIALDFASVDLALPALERQFSLDLQSVQWVINGYVLAFSVLMVAGGRMADAYGRRQVFLIGMGIFAVASLLGGMAWSGNSIILFRVLQGVGAALLWPAMIGMACVAVGDANRAMALGLIFGTCSVGNAAGPVIGGMLTEWFSWRWVLWVNVPMALFAMLVTLLHVPADKPPGSDAKNDYAGMITLTGGLVALMMVVYQAQDWGWHDPRTIGLAVLALGLLVTFPIIEWRSKNPLIPPDLMRNKEFLTLCLSVTVICQLFFIVLLYFTQYAMKFLGDDPIWAGARVVQFMLTYGLISYFGGPLNKFFGTRRLLLIGLASATIASVILGIYGPGASRPIFNGALMLLGVGVGAVIPTVSTRAIESVGTARASLVSGITFMCQLSGSALMLAVNTAIFTAVGTMKLNHLLAAQGTVLTAAQQETVANVMEGAQNIHLVREVHHNVAEIRPLADLLYHSYQSGLQVVLFFSAALVLVTFVLVACFVSKEEPSS